LRSLNLSFLDNFNDEALELISIPKSNNFHENHLSDRSTPHLQKLNISKSKITDLGLLKISTMRELCEIRLQWCTSITDEGIEALTKSCSKLKIIDLKSCSLTDSSIISITKNCKDIRCLDFSWCSGITDNGIQYLAFSNDEIETTSLPYPIDSIDSIDSYVLDNNDQLLNLAIDSDEFDEDKVVKSTADCPSSSLLYKLSLVWCPQLTNKALNALRNIPSLRALELAGCCGMTEGEISQLRQSGIMISF
jgi:hypothetical protein